MKKIVAFSLVLFFCIGLFASTTTSSFGVAFFNLKEDVSHENTKITSGSESFLAWTADLNSALVADDSIVGIDLGFSVLFSIEQLSVSKGLELLAISNENEDFFDCNFTPRIGLAMELELTKHLKLIGAGGYEIMYNHISDDNYKTSLFVHGVYGRGLVNYEVVDKLSLNFGCILYFPLVGTKTYSYSNYKTTLKYTFSGVSANPFFGISFSK